MSKAVNSYSRGTFHGTLKIKLESKAQRDLVVQLFRTKRRKYDSNKIWADVQTPLTERAERSFLFGLKTITVRQFWDYNRRALWVNKEDDALYLGDHDIVASASISEDGKDPTVQWGPDWEEHLKGGEVDRLTKRAAEKLAKSAVGSKAAGKGKKGAKGASE